MLFCFVFFSCNCLKHLCFTLSSQNVEQKSVFNDVVLFVCQVVSQYSNLLAPITVDAVLRVIDPSTADNVNLKDIRVVQKLGQVKVYTRELKQMHF